MRLRFTAIIFALLATGGLLGLSTCTSSLHPATPPTVSASPFPETTPMASPSPQPSYKPSQQVYDETFSVIKKLIERLNLLIQNHDYQAWLDVLSPEYQAYFSQPEILAGQNDSKFLQSRGVTIQTLKDYFLNVVAPSRTGVRLDDLLFLNENEVEAIMQVGNRRVTVYSLINIAGQWKIGLSKSGP